MIMVSASAFSQCSSCTPDYTCVADGFPVLCPSVLPDGTTGEEYLATATFNMPGSVVDPGSGITATLESITITSITIHDSVTLINGNAFYGCSSLTSVTFLGDAPKIEDRAFENSAPTIYRKADAKGWGDTLAGRPVKLITEKP